MKKTLTVAAAAITAGVGVTLASSNRAAIPPTIPATIVKKGGKPGESTLPVSGLYLAKPYSLLIVVPKPGDSASIISPSKSPPADGSVIKPPLRLEPKSPK